MNKVILIGNMTADIEIKTVEQLTIGSFSLAVNNKRGKKDETYFFQCTAFGKLAEVLKNYAGKGKKISVAGYLKQDRWEKDGQKQSRIGIVVEDIELLTPKDSQPKQEQPTNYPTSVSYTDNTQYVDIEDDGIF